MKKLLPLLLFLAACSDSDSNIEGGNLPPVPSDSKLVVVNQGSYYDGIDGALTTIDLKTGEAFTDAFSTNNGGISLGGSPQAATLANGKIYVPAFDSNVLWIIDAATNKVADMLTVAYPYMVIVEQGKIFVSCNDGYVNCYDEATLELIERTEVGPNPCHMAVVGEKLYVSISDGYNYPTYENGYRIAELNISDASLLGYIDVEMNPGQLCASKDGSIYAVCRGDYGATASKVLKVNPAAKNYTYVCEGSYIALASDRLYVIHSATDWTTYETHNYYKTYSLATDSLLSDNFLSDVPLPAMPNSIQCNAADEVFITSNAALYDYTSPGYLYHYAADGSHRATYSVGVAPCGVVFVE